MTVKEKRTACRSIIDTMDYGPDSRVSLCLKGNFTYNIVNENGEKRVEFSWSGKLAEQQANDDSCYGVLYTQTLQNRKKVSEVTEIECE
jgi:hypothetical protein